jgi:hypothetical protein
MKKIILFLIILGGVVSIGLRDQLGGWDDDPNLDQIPAKYREDAQNYIEDFPAAIVITDTAGYDEYHLGNAFAEPHMSMNPQDPKQIFAAYNTNVTYRTLDGINWESVNPNIPSAAGDPVTAFDSLGRLYYDNMYSPGANIVGTKLAYSDNVGTAWLGIVDANVGNDKNWIAADQSAGPYSNYVYGVMTPGNITRSTNRGQSFSITAGFTNQLPGMMVAVGPNGSIQGGTVHVVTGTGNSVTPTWAFHKSTDGGASYTTVGVHSYANGVGDFIGGRNSVQNMRTRPYPFIAADNSYGPYRGRFYMIYASNDPPGSGNKPDIWCRYSTDQGVTWSNPPVRINDNPNPTTSNEWFPSIWCDKNNGRLYAKWLDTRDCPTSDSALVYASYSTNGGQTFVTNQRVSSKKFRINCTTCGGGGTPAYLGDYDAIMSVGGSAGMTWTDFRQGNFASYFAYFPDYAVKTNATSIGIPTGGNGNVVVSVPSAKLYSDNVTFTAALQTPPSTGTISLTWQGGNNTVTSIPGQVTLNISASANVPAGSYTVNIDGRGPGGIPAHRRTVTVLINSSVLRIATNRPGIISYTVNGTSYNQPQEFVFPNGTNIQIVAPPEFTGPSTRYTFLNWSNGGNATQNITLNSDLNLVATYKAGYKLLVTSTYGTVTGHNQFFDSGSVANWCVSPRVVNVSGQNWYFHGWNGSGPNSYTSTDSSGRDTCILWPMLNSFVEIARWSTEPHAIHNISSEVPFEYKLHQNYPNPFNPVTRIKFDIIKSGNVKIIVYDLLGKEVAVLANEFLPIGRYEADFDASHLASGIYYYKITTHDFVSVRKMMLIK